MTFPEKTLDERITDLLRASAHVEEARLVVPAALSLSNLKRIANDFGVVIRVSRDCPPDRMYVLSSDDAEKVPCDFMVEPDRS